MDGAGEAAEHVRIAAHNTDGLAGGVRSLRRFGDQGLNIRMADLADAPHCRRQVSRPHEQRVRCGAGDLYRPC